MLMRIIVTVYPSAVSITSSSSSSKSERKPHLTAANRKREGKDEHVEGEEEREEEDGEKQRSTMMDRLCLALALITNLVQEVEHFASVLHEYS